MRFIQVRRLVNGETLVAKKLNERSLTCLSNCERGKALRLVKSAIKIEIFPSGYIVPYYWVHSDRADLDYYYLIGEGIPCSHLRQLLYPNPADEDILVDISVLEKTLQLADLM